MAGEPETLDTDEPLARRIGRHDFDRLLMLSDGVFAIAITLLALEIHVPENWQGDFGVLLAATRTSLAGYAIGFGLVGSFWSVHRRLFARLRSVDPVMTLANLALLAAVTLAPGVAKLMATSGAARVLPIYAALTVAISASQSVIWLRGMLEGFVDRSLSVAEQRMHLIRLALPGIVFGLLISAQVAGASVFTLEPLAVAALLLIGLRRVLDQQMRRLRHP